MEDPNAEELLRKYAQGLCTPEEKALVESGFLDELRTSKETASKDEIDQARVNILAGIEGQLFTVKKARPLWQRIAAAASIILAVSTGGYFLLHRSQPVQQMAQNQQQDILPGGNKAILTLANGKKIVLTNAANGTVASQKNVLIQKESDGHLSYQAAGTSTEQMVYDTLTIPKKGQFALTLEDGTKVWLNAATTIRYPEKFIGNERQIELISGEAYFAVVHNNKKTFRVKVHDQVIEDIGTEFNINAYADESAIKTTLVEGSVKLTANSAYKILKPGQQGFFTGSGFNVANADLEQVAAWKNGDFVFNGSDLETVMRQLSRWYDAKIEYRGNVSNIGFYSTISRSKKLSEVLKALQMTGGVHFKIEEGRIIVMP